MNMYLEANKTLQTRAHSNIDWKWLSFLTADQSFVLEEEDEFAKFQNGKLLGPNLGTKFIRFAGSFFTSRKGNP